MIVEEFNIPDLKLKYFVGINQISIDLAKLSDEKKLKNRDQTMDFIFKLMEDVQNEFDESLIQFFSNQFILDLNHIYNACYYVERAFINDINISNKKNLELFLYLATTRQIKIGIGAFGIKYTDLEKGELNYCIISPKNNLHEINERILQNLLAKEIELSLNQRSFDKYTKIMEFLGIVDKQIKVVLNSYGIKTDINDFINYNINDLYLALNDLICEKMTLLSLEKITIN